MVMDRRVALLANRVAFRLAHALAAHLQVVEGTSPDCGLLRESLIRQHARKACD
jgi:hypothetical protein